LNRLDPATRHISSYVHDPADPRSLSHNRVSAITEDRDGNLWVGTDGGLCRLDPARRTLERIHLDPASPDELPNQTVTALLVDDDGSIWFGTDGGGFCRYDPASRRFAWHRHSKYADNTLAADAVRTVFQDRSGDIWAGHFPSGISHMDRLAAAFQVFTSMPGETNTLSDDNVLSFLEDPSGDLWVGTDNGGLNHWSAATGRWRSYGHLPRDPGSLGGKAATDILRDHDGRLWVGTWDGGLNRFEPQTDTFRHYLPQPGQSHSLSDVHIWQMVEDHAHRLWIATIGGGLERYDPATDGFVHHRHDPANPRSLNDDIASALLVARDGTLWVGTPKGVARWNPATQDWDRFLCQSGHSGTLSNYWIFDLLEDRAGLIWATSEGGGLHRLDPRTGQCTHFRTADGLASDVLRGVLEDADGALWIGSNQGLMRFDPRTRHVRTFDETNGLPGRQLNPHARLRLASGDLLFGTTRGFIRFDPRALPLDTRPPPVVFTSFEVFNETMAPAVPGSPLGRSITETPRLEIPARLSVLSFQFAALSFRSPARCQYRFKLEGFDDEWRKSGTEHRATFTNLDPGRYRLRVQAANSDGVWNEAGASLELVVVPPWWRTGWFMSAATLLVLGGAAAVGGAVSAQRERETRQQHELATERERTQEREQAAEALRVLNQDLEHRVADRTAQLVSAIKELEAFSYSVSHDLRTPLRSIDGFSRVLLEDYADKLDADGKDSLQRIRAGSQRMGQLIDDLLTLSHVSRDEMRRGPVDLSALARTVAAELREAAPGQRMEFIIAPDLVATGDARLLQVLLENLLGNACKFSGRRPVARIEFGRTTHQGAPAYFVRDNGAGFDRAHAQKLFGAFQRFHTMDEFPGTGIGLATVQRIIHRHGGHVEAESQPDHGATFYFTLPEKPQELRP
jgi:signal transduction histidine kinase/ligand-binding sensor domain-containing protein